MISALFVNYRSWSVLEGALDSLIAQRTDEPLEVIVVDNASPGGALSSGDSTNGAPPNGAPPNGDGEAVAAAIERIRGRLAGRGELILHDRNDGYASGMALALERARGDLILTSNPDVEYRPGCLSRLVDHLKGDPTAGAVAPETFADRGLELRLPTEYPGLRERVAELVAAVHPGQLDRHNRRRVASSLRCWSARQPVELHMLPGWCFLMRRAVIDEVGFLDRSYAFYFEDTDLYRRLQQSGRRVVQVHGAQLVHHYNYSARAEQDLVQGWRAASRQTFYRRWNGRLGAWVDRAVERWIRTDWTRRRLEHMRDRHLRAVPMPREQGVPTVRFDRPHPRLLVELCLDPFFLLAAGSIVAGASWSPGPALRETLAALAPAPIYFRFVDLDRPRYPELGRYVLTAESHP